MAIKFPILGGGCEARKRDPTIPSVSGATQRKSHGRSKNTGSIGDGGMKDIPNFSRNTSNMRAARLTAFDVKPTNATNLNLEEFARLKTKIESRMAVPENRNAP